MHVPKELFRLLVVIAAYRADLSRTEEKIIGDAQNLLAVEADYTEEGKWA